MSRAPKPKGCLISRRALKAMVKDELSRVPYNFMTRPAYKAWYIHIDTMARRAIRYSIAESIRLGRKILLPIT